VVRPILSTTGKKPEADRLAGRVRGFIDAVLARSSRLLAGEAVPAKTAPQGDLAVLYDLDWDEDARLTEWRKVVDRTAGLPTVLRAALAIDAWADIEVLQRGDWIRRLLVATLLRQEGLAAHHLPCLHLGAQKIRASADARAPAQNGWSLSSTPSTRRPSPG
jgi:hypothetical protein